jgi:hypothetical protein
LHTARICSIYQKLATYSWMLTKVRIHLLGVEDQIDTYFILKEG